MKILFAQLDGSGKESFIEQMQGAQQLGHEVHCAVPQGTAFSFYCDGNCAQVPLPAEKAKRRAAIAACIRARILRGRYELVYLRSDFVDCHLLKIAVCARQQHFGAKVFLELADAPGVVLPAFKGETERLPASSFKKRLNDARFLIYQKKLRKIINAVILFGCFEKELYGISCFGLSGISTSQIRMRDVQIPPEAPVHLLGIVDNPVLCGFERLLKGMALEREALAQEPVFFDIIGTEQETLNLRRSVREKELDSYVRFLGPKTLEERNELWAEYSLGVSALALYRKGLEDACPPSMKQYCAAGLPVLYAFEDLVKEENVRFAMRVSNSDVPVSAMLAAEFVWRSRLDVHLARAERKYAERNYDWRVIMKHMIEFAATGRRED